ncbi:unnamed protein product [Arabidopsis arenosa]|uniref:peptidylprolyl isomerase n=1 Tax=Arabidopsis arenosa TaxID=38785 RepID=A0A8S1ZL45_ARAAE|nr:unnamed protein product [Arabidopsis arenosa]
MSVLIRTSLGDIVIDLYTDKAPKTCNNFLKLCCMKYYNGCLIHTVKDSIAETGDPTGTGSGGDSIYKFLEGDHARFFSEEIRPELKHSKTGTVAMVSSGENLNASQFYITLCDDLDHLDGKHTVFGETVEGFDVLTRIAKASVDAKNRPCKNIRIKHTYILEDPFDDLPQLAKLIPDTSPEGKPKEEVTDDGRLEYDWVPTDEELGPQELEEVINKNAAHSSAVLLETIEDIPEAVEDSSTLLYIWGLNPCTDADGLNTIFSRFGTVISVRILRDRKTGESLGCALIQFENEVASKEARLVMDNCTIDDRRISGPYSARIKKVEEEINELAEKINNLCSIKESDTDTGLSLPSQWDLLADKQMIVEEQPLHVATCTQIISPNTEDAKYVVDMEKIGKFVVGLGDKSSPTEIEVGMRVGVDRKKYQIQIPLPPKTDPRAIMMTVEEKPDITYCDIGGCKEQIEKIREVVELPMLHPEKFVRLGIDPPKGVLCYGPPGTGKTLVARAVANRTGACFIRIIGSELVQKYIGEGARMVRELFQMARSKKACILFIDEIDAIGGARFDDGVLMATNRPDILDPALLRPGRLDRKIEFCLPDLEGRTQIFKIHTRTMSCERDVRFELLAGLCPNSTGADIRSVCIEAGMYAIGARRKAVSEKDFLDAVNKVVKALKAIKSSVQLPSIWPTTFREIERSQVYFFTKLQNQNSQTFL